MYFYTETSWRLCATAIGGGRRIRGGPSAVGHIQSQASLVFFAKPDLLVARGWPTFEISDVLKVNSPQRSQPQRMSGKWAATASIKSPVRMSALGRERRFCVLSPMTASLTKRAFAVAMPIATLVKLMAIPSLSVKLDWSNHLLIVLTKAASPLT